jgi:hypothetical protein
MTISLRKPKIRLRSVPIPMVVAAFVILLFSDILDKRYNKMLKKSINSSFPQYLFSLRRKKDKGMLEKERRSDIGNPSLSY